MVFGTAELNELSSDWNIAREQLSRILESMASGIKTGWGQQHNADGSHGDIIADTMKLQGAFAGEVVNLPYDAARYQTYGSDALWNVDETDQVTLRYTRIGQLVVVQFDIQNSTLTGTDSPDDIVIRIPEFHALPKGDGGTFMSSGNGYASFGAVTFTTATSLPQTANIGIAFNSLVYHTEFFNTTPSTGIALEPVDTAIRQWSLGTTVNVNGFAAFFVEKDNAANPYLGT